MPTLLEGTVHAHQIWKRFRTRKGIRLSQIPMRRYRTAQERGTKWRWALQDVNFELEPGQSLGIVGPNGSGKSTLFKILAGVMYPEGGKVDVGGRVGALIEISSGIHPELSGRENVFLYGSLLGLPRREVARRLDAIVEFAELGDAIDQQAKFFSSGMRMRLGFAVAAFLEPNVLLVDEALAVGDASFQQKCLERMREVLAQGTTLLFVSHDLATVEATCRRGLWLDQGRVMSLGDVEDVVADYRRATEQVAEHAKLPPGPVAISSIEIGNETGQPTTHQDLTIGITLETKSPVDGTLYLGISEGPAQPIFLMSKEFVFPQGLSDLACVVHDLPLPRGRYALWAAANDRKGMRLMAWHPVSTFDVVGPSLSPAPAAVARLAPIHVRSTWRASR